MLGGQNFFFPNMVMWHIKLKGALSRTGYNVLVYCLLLLPLGMGVLLFGTAAANSAKFR